MELQYVSDSEGRPTAVLVPIAEWNNMTAKQAESKKSKGDDKLIDKSQKSRKKRPSEFAGTLTREEGEKFHEYLKQARSEWDRNF